MKRSKIRIPAAILDRLQPSETTVSIGSALVVGAGTGLATVGFIRLIALVQSIFFEGGGQALFFIGRWLFVLIPVAGGLLAGPIIAYISPEAKGHGVPEVMQAIALNGGRIRPRVVVAKVIASALCIGSGGSAGREGPIVQVGAAFGSTLGQWFNMSEDRIRNLVACGAAAGISATFNAPIAGVLFSMEIILGEFQLKHLGNVIISAVMASTIARVFLGAQPAFNIPHYAIKTPWEVLLYALLGAVAALFAVGFIRLLYWFEDRFDEWRFPNALKPAVGGLMLGAMAFVYPMILGLGFTPDAESMMGLPAALNVPLVFGSGFPVIETALLGKLSLSLLFILAFLKPLATSMTLGSGNSGGVFAPALFTGAAVGGAFGSLIEMVFPGMTAGPGAFAIVGMAAVFAGAARAPFTAFLIVFEMTDDYRMILPLMIGVIVSLLVAQKLERESIYTLKLANRGIHLQQGKDVDVMESVRVSEVMQKELTKLAIDTPIDMLAEKFIETGRHGFAVMDDGDSLYGIVSLEDYRKAVLQNKDHRKMTVGEIASQAIVSVYPDETVGTALRRMAPRDISRLPVVERDNPRHILGMVRRNDIVQAYELGVTSREDIHLSVSEARIREVSGLTTVEVRVEKNSICDGAQLGKLKWPRECIVVAIRRKMVSFIPHGDSTLKSGDLIVAVVRDQALVSIRNLCATKTNKEQSSPKTNG